jgi:hypothetical protein
MPTPNINGNCSILIFKYGAGGVFQGTYLNCGDFTPITLSATGGVSGNVYTVVNGISASADITTGSMQVSSQIGGFGQVYKTWTQNVRTTGW